MSKTITISDKSFELIKDQLETPTNKEGLEYCIIRCDRAGVFAGYVDEEKGQECVVYEARRLWYWNGAASTSQLAVDGVNKPDDCKFPVALKKIKLKDVIEITPTTSKAQKSIANVKTWEV